MTTKRDQLQPADHLILGGTVAIISKTAVAPLERIKLLVQCQGELLKSGRLTEPYKGVVDCAACVLRTEGAVHFWRGNLTSIFLSFSHQAMSFAFNDKMKTLLNVKKTGSYGVTFAKNILSGGMSGATTLCFVYSLSYARTRLANDIKVAGKGAERQFSGLIDVYRKTLKSDGFVGLYRGFVISCVGIVVYRSCYFGFFDTLRPIVIGDNASVTMSFLLGYIVTISAGLISYPLDTVRHRMIMTSCERVKYNGSIDCAMQILKREGAMSFMRGAGVNILRGVAGAGVLAGYDRVKKYYIVWRLK